MNLNIAWLYPKQMSTYGDRGNIITFVKRCRWRNIDVNIDEIDLGDKIDSKKYDLYFFGGGQDRSQIKVSEDLQKIKRGDIVRAVDEDAVFLSICGGYQLLGHYYQPSHGNKLEGVGILDVVTRASNTRMIGNLVIKANKDFIRNKFNPLTLVGFENHSGKTYLGKKASPLGLVEKGFGNNGEDKTEGAVQRNVFGCYLHGPLLPKNPHFADLLIKTALSKRFGDVELKNLKDSEELLAHDAAIKRSRSV